MPQRSTSPATRYVHHLSASISNITRSSQHSRPDLDQRRVQTPLMLLRRSVSKSVLQKFSHLASDHTRASSPSSSKWSRQRFCRTEFDSLPRSSMLHYLVRTASNVSFAVLDAVFSLAVLYLLSCCTTVLVPTRKGTTEAKAIPLHFGWHTRSLGHSVHPQC